MTFIAMCINPHPTKMVTMAKYITTDWLPGWWHNLLHGWLQNTSWINIIGNLSSLRLWFVLIIYGFVYHFVLHKPQSYVHTCTHTHTHTHTRYLCDSVELKYVGQMYGPVRASICLANFKLMFCAYSWRLAPSRLKWIDFSRPHSLSRR